MSLGGGGSSGGTTQTIQKSEPWSGQKPYLQNVMANAKRDYHNRTPDVGGQTDVSFFPGQLNVERNPLELQAEQSALGYYNGAGYQGSLQNAQNQVNNNLLGENSYYDSVNPAISQMASGNPFSNPYTAQLADVSARQSVDQFNKYIAPSLRANTIRNQVGGGTRQDIAAGLAGEGLAQRISDNTTQLYGNAYNQALDRQAQGVDLGLQAGSNRARDIVAGVGIMPSLDQMAITPSQVAGQIGANQRGYDQAVRDEQVQRHNFDVTLPERALRNYSNAIQGNYGGTTESMNRQGGGGGFGNVLSGTAGGALSGGLIGSQIGSIGGPVGSVIGGGLGLLGSLF